MRSLGHVLCLTVALAATMQPAPARAQTPSTGGSAAPQGGARLPRFDLGGSVGWANGREEVRSVYQSDDWYHDAGWFGVSAGYYWTEHVKIEFDVGATGEGHIYATEEINPGPAFTEIFSDHSFSTRRAAGYAVYQFRHNAWVHPFIGAGFEVEKLRHRVARTFYSYGPPGGSTSNTADVDEPVGVRPLVTAGIKVYVTPRAFLRTDVVASFGSTRDRALLRCGFGVDF